MKDKLINETHIDLACGIGKREGYFGIDVKDQPGVDCVMNLEKYPWNIESDSVEDIYCSHYVEHIPHILEGEDKRDGLIQFMNEVYRILKVGGRLNVIAPYYTSIRAFGDPTHVRFICDMSFNYFNAQWRKEANIPEYGINCNFDIKISYRINNEMALKSEEVRAKAFVHDWNVIEDIIVEMVKI